MKISDNKKVVNTYVEEILSGKKNVNKYQQLGVKRYVRDQKNKKYRFDTKEADFVITIIENMFVHLKGETLDGKSLPNTPLKLQPFQKYIIYNLLCFYDIETGLRRYQEAFIYMPRKNGKTLFISALSWALSILQRKSNSICYIVASSAIQSQQAIEPMINTMRHLGIEDKKDGVRIVNNNQERSLTHNFDDGSMYVQALAANPDKQDSLGCNLVIADELHSYKTPKQYNVLKEATKAYANKMVIGITTAGDDMSSFCYQRLQYCKQILDETVTDEQYFVFIAEADENENGYLDYTNPKVHEMANPAYGITIRPQEMLKESHQAENDPQSRKDFLSKSLNVYTSAREAYFDVDEFRESDEEYDWGYKDPITSGPLETVNYEELAELPIKWYGGADLSEQFDLTAVGLYGEYKDIGIFIPHSFYPRTRATEMADELNIPYFAWEEEGWLTFTNSDIVETVEVAQWFNTMRDKGFDIVEIGYDRQMAREFVRELKEMDFKVRDIGQYMRVKSEGFRHIELKMKAKKLYYLHSSAYEYCIQNVEASTQNYAQTVKYKKRNRDMKIDIFEASVFGALTYIENELEEQEATSDEWEW